jgi:2-keto-4-pentenoate hydratase/2-oxohepta-3-ene-1,7-dioic acid hydratase in catechol pathway
MKIICIGRNYAAHAAEMKAERPSEPVVFLKPPTALLVNNKPLYYPEFTQDLHYEVELVLKIAKNGRHVQPEFAADYIGEIALGIDFTARDLQATFKKKGQPWELAKGFDGSAPISEFIGWDELPDPASIHFGLRKNGSVVQQGDSADMLFSFTDIICFVSRFFKLQMGDYIFTGTPEGVGPVVVGDELEGYIETTTGPRTLLNCRIK